MSISVSNFYWKGLALAVIAIFLLVASLPALAQSPTTAPEMGIYGAGQQLASLRPGQGLMWQRTSPTVQRPDGPVLYQLLFNASGTPGTVPVFDANPRHLGNSPITVSNGNVVIGGNNGLIINGSNGLVTFSSGQVFPGATGVNSVNEGNVFIAIGGTPLNPTVGLNTTATDLRYLQLGGGVMTGNIVFAVGQTFPASGLPNLAGEVTGPPGTTVVSNAVAASTANAIVRRDNSGNFSASSITLGGNLALPNTASASVGMLTLGGAPFLHNFGALNTFVGASAGNLSLSGVGDTGVGSSVLLSDTTGHDNSALGAFALYSNTTGSFNAAVGNGALASNTTGGSNAAFGSFALNSNTTGAANSAFGIDALVSNTTASNNAAFGTSALQNNTTGVSNDAFGFHALIANTTGTYNSAFGDSTLAANTTANNNSAFGFGVLFSNTAYVNSAFGAYALNANTTGVGRCLWQ